MEDIQMEESLYIEIDYGSNVAIYLQLCNQIILAIATKTLHEGDNLPSVRSMAETLGVNMHTVNKAYSVLRDAGFLTVDRRRGAIIYIDQDKMSALEDLRRDLSLTLAKARCKNVTREEVHALIDEICEDYK